MNKLCVALLVAGLCGCATQKEWAATGGSRSDGVVRLSYEYNAMEVPQLNDQQAVSIATRRCQTWGYTGAEPFGGGIKRCNLAGGLGGCQEYLGTKEFQCTGTGGGATK